MFVFLKFTVKQLNLFTPVFNFFLVIFVNWNLENFWHFPFFAGKQDLKQINWKLLNV